MEKNLNISAKQNAMYEFVTVIASSKISYDNIEE